MPTSKAILYLIFLSFFSCKRNISLDEKNKSNLAYLNSQKAVKEWILKYAKYPDSYSPTSWGQFEEAFSSRKDVKIPNSESYVIFHSHKILDIDSIPSTFSGYFILDNQFEVNIIEENRSNTVGGTFPPIVDIWMNKYGRAYNQNDSLEMNKKAGMVTDQIIKELMDGLNNGSYKSDNPEDLENLKKMLDSLPQKDKH